MEKTCYDDFKNNLGEYAHDVVVDGDILHVTTENGAFVVMEESEYKVLRDATEMLIKSVK